MRLLVDAQLPVRLATRLGGLGHDAVHISSLPRGNRTTDVEISEIADRESRIVVTKDTDFRNSHLLQGSPSQVLVIATGNISNTELLTLCESCLSRIEDAFVVGFYVELRHDGVVSHRPPGS